MTPREKERNNHLNAIIKRSTALLLAVLTVLIILPISHTEAASMKHGSKGEDVRQLQVNLIGLGYLTGEADGSYGSKTVAAVKKFQEGQGLTADGNAGPATQTALRNTVIRIQVELKKLGYSVGNADGDYGSKTNAAVAAFQKAVGLKKTGFADSSTLAAMEARSGGMDAGSTIRKGTSGTRVRHLQQALSGLGFYAGKITTTYDAKTEAAVAAFQKAYGLKVDGSAGKNTMNALKNAVIALQSDLARKGYKTGTINGIYGDGTKSAVYNYQNDVNITLTGIAGPSTMRKLYGFALGGSDPVITSRHKTWIDSLYQSKDNSVIWYRDRGKKQSTTVKRSGCGGVTTAMALNALLNTDRFTGQNVMQWFADHDYYWGKGTDQAGIWDYPRRLNLNTSYCDKEATLISHLKKDHLAIALVKDKTEEALFLEPTSRGHFVLISGYRELNGLPQVFVNNSITSKESRWFDIEDIMNNVCNEDEGYAYSFVIIYK